MASGISPSALSTADLRTKSGDPIPRIGLGTWQSEPEKVADVVYEAIKMGYRHIDCAAQYGNEAQVGKGLTKAIQEGLAKREDLWITSKLWNDRHRQGLARGGLEQTLKDLNTPYLDLYLMHWPVSFVPQSGDVAKDTEHADQQPGVLGSIKDEIMRKVSSGPPVDSTNFVTTWLDMEPLVDAGLSRYIGISNFNPQELDQLLEKCNKRPSVHQYETHPYLPQTGYLKQHGDLGIVVTAYSPLGNVNPSYDHDPPTRLLEHGTVKGVAKREGCTPAQVLLKWGMMRGTVVIPKSVRMERVKENLGSLNCSLSDMDFQEIGKISEATVKRFNNPGKKWGIKFYEGLEDI